MARARRGWLGLAAAAIIAALVATGWLVMRTRQGPPHELPPIPAAARAPGPGTASLRWDPVDPRGHGAGTRNDPIAGFHVYVGSAPDRLRLEATLDDPRATGYVVRGLPRGTWYYTVTTYTTLGIESEQPPPVSKTIR